MIDWMRIKPCPFCGRVGSLFIGEEDGIFFMRCADSDFGCCATGPIGSSEEEAVELWNTRAGLTQEEPDR